MILFYVLLAVLILAGLRLRNDECWLSKDATDVIKGVFIVMVFCRIRLDIL